MTHIEDNIDLNEVFNIGRTNGGYDRHSRSASIATSKASQQKSRTSTASSQSTLRPSTPPPQPAARSTAPPEPNLYVPHEPTEDTSSLMEKVFSSVHLEPVLYSGRGERYDAYDAPPPPQPRQQAPAPPPPQQAHNEEHHQVLEDFDKILGSGTGTSLRSSKAASRRSTFTQEDRRSSHYEVTASVVAHKLEEHNSNHYEEHHDETDSFNNGFGTPQLPGARVEKDGGFRNRTQTMDSLASLAESRFGDFDVQDDSGHFKGSTINIFHNDVAYQRPKQKKAKGPPVPAANLAASVAEEARVRRVQEQARAAQAHQALLEQQVRREQEEVRRLQQRTDQAERELGRSSGVRSPHTGVTVGDFIGRINRSNSESTTRASTDSTNIYEEEQVTVSEIAARQRAYGTEVQVAGKTHLIIPQKHEIPNFSVNPNIHKVIVGGEQQVSDEDKTILLFGPEGSGKSAAINSIANYLYDVKKENDFRFVVEDPSYHPTAPSLTAYQFNNTILGFAVTVVDTAGVKNEKGYKTTSELIKTWFEQELVDAGKFKLDAISIVLRHDEDNLGWPFIYELAAVKKLFGDDLKTNVLPIITHSEVLPQPVAIRSLALANVAFVEYYKVNNSGFFPPPAGSNRLQHNLYFSHGIASLERLFRDLQELIHPLLAILKQHNSLVNKPTLRSPTSPTGHH